MITEARRNSILMFAIWRFMWDSSNEFEAAAQDKVNRHYQPGDVEKFARDYEDAKEIYEELRNKQIAPT